MTLSRRRFLFAAPAIVAATSLMPIWAPKLEEAAEDWEIIPRGGWNIFDHRADAIRYLCRFSNTGPAPARLVGLSLGIAGERFDLDIGQARTLREGEAVLVTFDINTHKPIVSLDARSRLDPPI